MPRTPVTEPPLAPKIFQVLLALADGPLNGYQTTLRVEENTGGAVTLSPATLYENLHRLAEAGLIEEVSDLESDGRGQRFYRLAAPGEELLRSEVDRLAHDVALARASAALRDR